MFILLSVCGIVKDAGGPLSLVQYFDGHDIPNWCTFTFNFTDFNTYLFKTQTQSHKTKLESQEEHNVAEHLIYLLLLEIHSTKHLRGSQKLQ